MPTSFPHRDDRTGELKEVKYWDAKEAARLLRVSPDYLRERCRRLEWPHLLSVGHYFLNADHIARVTELRTRSIDTIQALDPKARQASLGLVMNEDDLADLESVQ